MLLVIDIGNTNINLGVFAGSQNDLLFSFAISAVSKRTPDEYTLLFNNILREHSIGKISSTVISSVVPSLTGDTSIACKNITGCNPFIIGTGTHTGFPIKLDVQSQLGADIVSNTAAAFEFCKPPFAVVDVGTATTVTAVNSAGQLVGTVIAPGASISLNALNDSCALLTDVSFTCPDAIIGKNSQDSIRSGAFYGHIYMIDGFIRQLREDLCKNGEKLSLIGTGGLSDKLLPHCRNKFQIIPNLTLRGAATIYYLNRNKRTPNYTK